MSEPKNPRSVENPSPSRKQSGKARKSNTLFYLAIAFEVIVLLGILVLGLLKLEEQGIIRISGMGSWLPESKKTTLPAVDLIAESTLSRPDVSNKSVTITAVARLAVSPTISPTLRPSLTPIDTYTPIPSLTLAPTLTQEVLVQAPDTPSPSASRPSKTATPNRPTNTPPKQNTATKPPKITGTCGVSPSIVTGATITTITLYALFSPPNKNAGYGFCADVFDPSYSGHKGCCATDGDGDGYASCEGRSGMVPYGKTTKIKFMTSFGDCYATISGQ